MGSAWRIGMIWAHLNEMKFAGEKSQCTNKMPPVSVTVEARAFITTLETECRRGANPVILTLSDKGLGMGPPDQCVSLPWLRMPGQAPKPGRPCLAGWSGDDEPIHRFFVHAPHPHHTVRGLVSSTQAAYVKYDPYTSYPAYVITME